MTPDDETKVTRGGAEGGGESLTDRTLGALFWMSVGTTTQAVFRVAVIVVLARLLAPADFGLVSAAAVVLGLVGLFSELGISETVVQRPAIEERHVRTGFTVSVLFGALLAVVVALLAPLVAAWFRMPGLAPVLRVMALAFPLGGLALMASALLRRELQFRQVARVEIISYVFGYGLVGVALALAGWGVWALVAGNLTQDLLQTALLLRARPHPKRPQLERGALRELMYFGSGFTVAGVCNYFAINGDNLVVGRWLGAAALGLYGRAYNLMTTSVTLFGKVLKGVLIPAMAKVQHEPERLAVVYRRGVALVALLLLPASAAAYVLAPSLIRVLLGPGWDEAVAPFQILTVGTLFRAGYKIGGSLAHAMGAVYRHAWRRAVYAALVVGGSWVGHFWGLKGVALGVLLALFVNYVLTAQLGLRLTSMSWRQFLAAHLPGAWLAVLIYAEVWATSAALAALGAPVGVVLAGSLAVVGLTLAALVWFRPGLALGKDGMWMLTTLAEFGGRKFGFLRRFKKGLDAAPSSA